MENNIEKFVDRYRLVYDLHTHTTYSHGKGSVGDNVREAFNQGMDYIAISDHGPVHLAYGVNREDFVNVRNDVEKLKFKYPKLNVRLSLEANIIKRSPYLDIRPEEFEEFDFIIAGYHFAVAGSNMIRNWLWSKGIRWGEDSLRESNTQMVINCLKNNKISVLTHPGDKGPFDLEAIADVCAKTDTLMEINTWHGHLTEDELRIVAKNPNVKFIIGSDAHTPDRVGDYKEGVRRAIRAGVI